MDSHCALGDSAARGAPPSADGNIAVLPMVVAISKWRMARPSAKAASTDPPSESRTRVAPRTSLSLAKASKSKAVLSVTTPDAEIHLRQSRPHCSAGPSVRHSKRMVPDLASSFATDRLLANATMQAHANAKAPTR